MTLAILIVSPRLARADAKATAAVLFEQGAKDLAAGDVKKACKELTASNEALPDSGTTGLLAECFTADGRITSAWQLWHELVDTAPTADLRDDAAKHATALEPRLPHFVVQVDGATPGLVVTADGNKINLDISVPLPVDPGTFAVSASAPGYRDWKQDFTATERQVTIVTVPALVAVAATTPPKPAEPEASKPPPSRPADKVVTAPLPVVAPSQPTAPPSQGRSRRKWIAVAVGGAGIAALAVGGVFGAQANSSWSTAQTDCGGSTSRCLSNFQQAESDIADARSTASIATGFAIAGGVAVIAGVALYLTAPKREAQSASGVASLRLAPVASPQMVGLVIGGDLR